MSYSTYVLNERISNITSALIIANSKISALEVPANPNELSVIDTIIVSDSVTPTQQTTIGSNLTTFIVNGDDNTLDISNIQVHLENMATLEEIFLTNVSWLIKPVKSIKPLGYNYNRFEISKKILDLITKDSF